MPASISVNILTRFPVAWGGSVAFGIVQHLWAHRDVQSWVEYQWDV